MSDQNSTPAAELVNDSAAQPTPDNVQEPAPQVDNEATGQDNASDNPAAAKHTADKAKLTLDRFERKLVSQRDANFEIAELAHQFILEYLGCSKEAKRSVGVMKLIDVMGRHDDAAFMLAEKEAVSYLRKRLAVLLEAGAAARLIGDGRGIEKGNATAKGRGKGKPESRLPWSVMVEFSRLVWRKDDDASEEWHILASVEAEAKALLVEVARAGLPADNVRLSVRQLRLKDAEIEYEAAVAADDETRIARAHESVQQWGGSVQREVERQERKRKAKETASAPPATPPATLDPTPPAPQGQETPPAAIEAPQVEDCAPEEPEAPPATETQGECRAKHLIQSGSEMLPKDAAGWIMGFITDNQAPDDVVIELLRLVSLSKEMSKPVKNATAVAWHALAERYGTEMVRETPAAELIQDMRDAVEDAVMDAVEQAAA